MTLEEAKQLLDEEYKRAFGLEYVKNPLAYALHQVWKKVDEENNGMGDYKYIEEYTDETTVKTLKTHGALSIRTSNILDRSGFKNIGEFKRLKFEEILLLRNAGRNCAKEIEAFVDAYEKINRNIERDAGGREMNQHDATEIAYKNGYAKGKADTVKKFRSILFTELLKVAKCQVADEPNMRSREVFRILDQTANEMAVTEDE